MHATAEPTPTPAADQLIAAFDLEIRKISAIRDFLAQHSAAIAGWHTVTDRSRGVLDVRLLQLHRINPLDSTDPRVIARAIGIDWRRDGSSWRGLLACDIAYTVLLHNAEPKKPELESIEL